MDESIEGSPGAARSAQPESQIESDETGGFFRRVIGIFNPNDDEDDGDEVHETSGAAIFGVDRLRDVTVEDVAIPTAEIVAVPVDISLADLVQVFRESGMSRLPVYEGTLDTPLGLIHLKDFALKHGFNGKGARLSIRPMLRPLLYVPPSMPIGVLMQKMQAERRHMALVIDEHDTDDDAHWHKEGPGRYLAAAKTPLDQFEAEIGLSLTDADEVDEEEIDTLGGLVFMLLGRVPARGEVIEHPTGASLEVVEADPRRIKRVRVRVPSLAGE